VAAGDSHTTDPADRKYIRYVFIRTRAIEDLKALSALLQYLSRSSAIVRPVPTDTDTFVLKIDARKLAPQDADLLEWLTVWEELQYDPAFNRLLTADSIKLLKLEVPEEVKPVVKKVKKTREVKKAVPPYFAKDGVRYDYVWVTEEYEEAVVEDRPSRAKVDVVRLDGPHANPGLLEHLRQSHGTAAPIVTLEYLLFRSTSTFKGSGPYRTIYGGLYYEFSGTKKAKDLNLKATDEDVFYERLGVTNIAAGFTVEKFFERLRSDQRVGVFRSHVTGKPRRVDLFPTPAHKNGGLVSTTHDPATEDIDVLQHPIMSLGDFRDKARETIATGPNGFHRIALFNGDGTLQDAAPSNVVKDHNIPVPHTADLQGLISCIGCHGPHDGWQPLQNDVKRMLARYKKHGVNVFGDITELDRSIPDTLDRIAGWYEGDPRTILQRGRDDYAEAVLRATGPWPDSPDQTDVVKKTSAQIQKIYYRHWYDAVTPKVALQELGITAKEEEAAGLLETLLMPDPEEVKAKGVVPEDPRISALMDGIAINRVEWDLTYSFAADRARHRMAAIVGGKR
jgi:hypothetical protein